MNHPTIIILIGFDRCGSTMISKLLAKNPKINLLFQPFNNSELTQSQWEIWKPEFDNSIWYSFFRNLSEKGAIDHEHIKSQWFFNHSTSLAINSDQLNLIKDTKLHFKVNWLMQNFPNIIIRGIWRDPRAILCSLVRNNFHETWYGHLNQANLNQLIRSYDFFEPFYHLLDRKFDQLEVMATGLALRTYYLLLNLSSEQWLNFKEILNGPNKALQKFSSELLATGDNFNYHKFLEQNYNIAGKPFENQDLWQSYFTEDQKMRINKIFSPLFRN